MTPVNTNFIVRIQIVNINTVNSVSLLSQLQHHQQKQTSQVAHNQHLTPNVLMCQQFSASQLANAQQRSAKKQMLCKLALHNTNRSVGFIKQKVNTEPGKIIYQSQNDGKLLSHSCFYLTYFFGLSTVSAQRTTSNMTEMLEMTRRCWWT